MPSLKAASLSFSTVVVECGPESKISSEQICHNFRIATRRGCSSLAFLLTATQTEDEFVVGEYLSKIYHTCALAKLYLSYYIFSISFRLHHDFSAQRSPYFAEHFFTNMIIHSVEKVWSSQFATHVATLLCFHPKHICLLFICLFISLSVLANVRIFLGIFMKKKEEKRH